MPTVLDLAELANAAYSFPASVEVPRSPPPRPGAAGDSSSSMSSSSSASSLSSSSAPSAPAWCAAGTSSSSSGGVLGAASTSVGPLGSGGTGASSPPAARLFSSTAAASPRRWVLRQRWPQSDRAGGGFAAAVYQAEDSRERVLAYRGTNPNEISDLASDLEIAVGAVPSQTFPALVALRESGIGEREYLTGHSLGGALAILVAAETRRPAVTFNAPGVMDSCLRLESATTPLPGLFALLRAVARCAAGDRVRNYRIGGDPVSSWLLTGMQSGTDASELDASQCGVLDGLCRHSMENVVTALRRDPASYVELR